MGHPLIDKILKEGPGSTNVSMLSPEVRKKLLGEAGNLLVTQNRYDEAIEAFVKGGCNEDLRAVGDWLLQQRRTALAARFLRHVERPDVLEKLGQDCIAIGEIAAAKEVYASLNDTKMLTFLRENFP